MDPARKDGRCRRGLSRAVALLGCLAACFSIWACGEPERDNPFDPQRGGSGDGVDWRLTVDLPVAQGQLPAAAARLHEISYQIRADDIDPPIQGTMNLVGARAQALAQQVPSGEGRIVRADGWDEDRIRIYAAEDTFALDDRTGQEALLTFERLRGSVELVGAVPPEMVQVEVGVFADGDSVLGTFASQEAFQNRLEGVPTGAGATVWLRGFDAEGQLLIDRQSEVDVRAGLPAQVDLALELGAIEIEAQFPEFSRVVPIDRFTDAAGLFYRRSQQNGLPGPNEPIDFDRDFLFGGRGPNGERVDYYFFDVQTDSAPAVYILTDRRGEPVEGQLPIFDRIPGEAGYSDVWRVHTVRLTALEYTPNSINAASQIFDGEFEVESTLQGYHAVMVPDGSSATRRWDPQTPALLQNGWYRGDVVKFLLFENPTANPLALGVERVETPQLFGFLANDRDILDGFAIDPGSGLTHNIFAVLPGEESYAPLWVLQIFKLVAFDRFNSLADAIREDPENAIDVGILHVNAPVVSLIADEGVDGE